MEEVSLKRVPLIKHQYKYIYIYIYIYIYMYIYNNNNNNNNIAQNLLKMKHEVKWMVKFVKT